MCILEHSDAALIETSGLNQHVGQVMTIESMCRTLFKCDQTLFDAAVVVVVVETWRLGPVEKGFPSKR